MPFVTSQNNKTEYFSTHFLFFFFFWSRASKRCKRLTFLICAEFTERLLHPVLWIIVFLWFSEGCFSNKKKCTNFPFGRRLHVWGHVWRWGGFPVGESRRLIPQTECVGDPGTMGGSSKCFPSMCDCLLTGEPSGTPQPSGRLSGHASHIAEPQRGGGASANHAERAGDGSGSRQHPWQQRGHANNLQPGENRQVWRTDDRNTFVLPRWSQRSCVVPLFLPLWFRETPPTTWLRCLQGPQSVMISSARPCSKRCKPPTCPLCRWGPD